jgi:hypothetical protein
LEPLKWLDKGLTQHAHKPNGHTWQSDPFPTPKNAEIKNPAL